MNKMDKVNTAGQWFTLGLMAGSALWIAAFILSGQGCIF